MSPRTAWWSVPWRMRGRWTETFGEVVVVGGSEGGEGEIEEGGEDENGGEGDESELRASKGDGGETHGACVRASTKNEGELVCARSQTLELLDEAAI